MEGIVLKTNIASRAPVKLMEIILHQLPKCKGCQCDLK